MKTKLSACLTFIAAIIAPTVVYAATDYSVPVRPDGQKCVTVGAIPNFRQFTEPAGVVYFTDKPDQVLGGNVNLPANIVAWSPYDWDSVPKTQVAVTYADGTFTNQFIETGQNTWGETYPITKTVTMMRFLIGGAHPSTWICFLAGESPVITPTPVVTLVPTETPTEVPVATVAPLPTQTPTAAPVDIAVRLGMLDTPPTNLKPGDEPVRPASESQTQIAIGEQVTVTARIENVGKALAENVVITSEVNGQVKVLTVGNMPVNQVMIVSYTTCVKLGTNTFNVDVYTAGDTNPNNNSGSLVIDGVGGYFLPIIYR